MCRCRCTLSSSSALNVEIGTKVYYLVKHIGSSQVCTFVILVVVWIPRGEFVCDDLGALFQINTGLDETTHPQIMTLDQSKLVARESQLRFLDGLAEDGPRTRSDGYITVGQILQIHI